MNIDGTGCHVLFELQVDPATLGFADDRFALSPAGDRFVFSTLDPDHPETGLYVIVTSALDGTDRKGIRRSTPFAGWGDPSWR